MKKTTKGTLAAAAAGTLLLGGAGSYAFWTSTTNVDGTALTSGHLKITNSNCDTAGWTLDEGNATLEAPYASQLLVPGDVLTKTCTFDVDAAGDHLQASFGASAPDTTGSDSSLLSELQVSADYFDAADNPVGPTNIAVLDGTNTYTVKLKVAWPYGVEDNDSNDVNGLSAVLNDITITATQSDNH